MLQAQDMTVTVLNKSLTLQVLDTNTSHIAIWATLCHLICDMLGFSLHKQESILTKEREKKTVESHLSSWNPVGHFWISGAFCECSDAGNVTVSISHQAMFPR